MVVAPGDIPVSRADVVAWLSEWENMTKADRPTVRDFLNGKIDELGLEDYMVTRAYGDNLKQEHITDVILADLESYGVDPSS